MKTFRLFFFSKKKDKTTTKTSTTVRRRVCVYSVEMAYKCREEIVGKRFLSVSSGFSKLKSTKISEWGWRAGVIRASTHRESNHPDLQVKNN